LQDPSLDGASQRDVVGALAFSPDDQWLATAGFREVRLWQRRPVTVESCKTRPSMGPASAMWSERWPSALMING